MALEDVAAYLRTSSNSHLSLFLAAAEAAVVGRVGPVSPTVVTEWVDGPPHVLRWPQVLELISVSGASTAGLSVMDGIVKGLGSGSREFAYRAGFDPIPDDLKLAILELTRHFWSTQRGNAPGLNALPDDQMPGMTYESYEALPRRVEQLLHPYMTVSVA